MNVRINRSSGWMNGATMRERQMQLHAMYLEMDRVRFLQLSPLVWLPPFPASPSSFSSCASLVFASLTSRLLAAEAAAPSSRWFRVVTSAPVLRHRNLKRHLIVARHKRNQYLVHVLIMAHVRVIFGEGWLGRVGDGSVVSLLFATFGIRFWRVFRLGERISSADAFSENREFREITIHLR